jgi:DNA-binding transcriptional MerR regulator
MNELASLPDKKYFSIGEVSTICKIKPHVLRYWESEFPQLSPRKRKGNRRYYQSDDLLLVQRIKFLLYEKGFTINGAKQSLREKDAGVCGTSKRLEKGITKSNSVNNGLSLDDIVL